MHSGCILFSTILIFCKVFVRVAVCGGISYWTSVVACCCLWWNKLLCKCCCVLPHQNCTPATISLFYVDVLTSVDVFPLLLWMVLSSGYSLYIFSTALNCVPNTFFFFFFFEWTACWLVFLFTPRYLSLRLWHNLFFCLNAPILLTSHRLISRSFFFGADISIS